MVWGVMVYCGATVLLAQLGRDLGKRKERQLFAEWGGAPTLRLLRHRDAENPYTVTRYHSKLKELMPDLVMPSYEEEKATPDKADKIYESCILFLREHTRDKKKFHLLFEEVVNYGFRRNLWAMKPLGLSLVVFSLVAELVNLYVEGCVKKAPIHPLVYISLALTTVFLAMWVWLFTRDWVKISSDAYAERLLGASEQL